MILNNWCLQWKVFKASNIRAKSFKRGILKDQDIFFLITFTDTGRNESAKKEIIFGIVTRMDLLRFITYETPQSLEDSPGKPWGAIVIASLWNTDSLRDCRLMLGLLSKFALVGYRYYTPWIFCELFMNSRQVFVYYQVLRKVLAHVVFSG